MLHRANGRGIELQWSHDSHDRDGALEDNSLAGKVCVSIPTIATRFDRVLLQSVRGHPPLQRGLFDPKFQVEGDVLHQ